MFAEKERVIERMEVIMRQSFVSSDRSRRYSDTCRISTEKENPFVARKRSAFCDPWMEYDFDVASSSSGLTGSS